MPSLPLRTTRLWLGDSAQTGESQASNSCCSAGPPRPPSPRSPAVHPQPAQGPPGATPRELGEGASIAAPSSLSAKSFLAQNIPCVLTSDYGPRGGIVVTHRALDRLFIAGSPARGCFGLRGSQQVVADSRRDPASLHALLRNGPGDHCAAYPQATQPPALPRTILLALGSNGRMGAGGGNQELKQDGTLALQAAKSGTQRNTRAEVPSAD